MNKTNKIKYWYEGHLGSLFFSDTKIDGDDLYCDECGASDMFISVYNTWKEAYLGLVDQFSDKIENYDTKEEIDEYYDPDYCMYDKKYICEVCNNAYGPITMEDFIDIMNLQNKKVLINVRLYEKESYRVDEMDGVFAGYFIIENGKYKFKSNVDTEEWDDMWNIPIKYFEHIATPADSNSEKAVKDSECEEYFCICFDLTKKEGK